MGDRQDRCVMDVDAVGLNDYPRLGDKIIIKKHGLCHHLGQVGVVVDMRFAQDNPTAIRVSFDKGKFNYWLPILKGEVRRGFYAYFQVVPRWVGQ